MVQQSDTVLFYMPRKAVEVVDVDGSILDEDGANACVQRPLFSHRLSGMEDQQLYVHF